MNEPIVSLSHIRKQAKEAALKFTNVNHCCPYPYGTGAGQAFRAEFILARAAITSGEDTDAAHPNPDSLVGAQ